jgi:serine/threonine-protein kinase
MTLAPGLRVTPALELVRQLGQGGMGTVWIARHHGLSTDVVVKFISGHLAQQADIVARFRREAAAASEVRSPHVVQMLDYGVTAEGLPFIVMELLEGENLEKRIERLGKLPLAETAGLVVQIARALSRAHDKGFIHRDIKPDNIFLCDTGENEAFVKVLDFGIAKAMGPEELSGTATGAMIGTPYFMSPEQVMGSKTIDHRTDLWSLGVVVFNALTGVRPFEGETIGALSVRICSGELPIPSSVNPALPASVDEWFAIACAHKAPARFPSARAMADALVAAAGGSAPARVHRDALRLSTASHLPTLAPSDLRPSSDPELATIAATSSPQPDEPLPTKRRPLGLYVGGLVALALVLGLGRLAFSAKAKDEAPAMSAQSSALVAAPSASPTPPATAPPKPSSDVPPAKVAEAPTVAAPPSASAPKKPGAASVASTRESVTPGAKPTGTSAAAPKPVKPKATDEAIE